VDIKLLKARAGIERMIMNYRLMKMLGDDEEAALLECLDRVCGENPPPRTEGEPKIIPFPGCSASGIKVSGAAPQINLEDLYQPGFILVGFQLGHLSGEYNDINVYWLPETGPYMFHFDFGPLCNIRRLKPEPRKQSGLMVALKLLEHNRFHGESVLLTPELLKPGKDRRPDYLNRKVKAQVTGGKKQNER
jgi:hypothetical protein